MKQQITRFEKSTPRLLAFVLLGVGLIGLGLVQGSTHIGLSLEAPGAYIMLLGFLGSTVFFFLMGSTPVAIGVETVQSEDRVQVQLSNELEADIKAKLDAAIKDLHKRNTETLTGLANVTEGMISEVEKLTSQFGTMDVESVVGGLKSLSDGLDLDTISSIKGSISTLTRTLDELNSLSTSESEKLENVMTEIRENFEAMNKEVHVALKQFQGFNS